MIIPVTWLRDLLWLRHIICWIDVHLLSHDLGRYSYHPGQDCNTVRTFNHHKRNSCRALKFSKSGNREYCRFQVSCQKNSECKTAKVSRDLNPPIESKLSRDNLDSIGGFKSRDTFAVCIPNFLDNQPEIYGMTHITFFVSQFQAEILVLQVCFLVLVSVGICTLLMWKPERFFVVARTHTGTHTDTNTHRYKHSTYHIRCLE